MIYFDSCYLVKLYLMERDSARVRARAEASDGLACCATGHGEVVATFHRHFREKRLTRREFRQLAATVARCDEQLRVRAHERDGHGHLRAVRQHGAELLDRAEDVVPPSGVQSG